MKKDPFIFIAVVSLLFGVAVGLFMRAEKKWYREVDACQKEGHNFEWCAERQNFLTDYRNKIGGYDTPEKKALRDKFHIPQL